MATIDQQFVEYIVKTLVNNPENVEVTRSIDEKGVLLKLTVDPEDVGRVIGRRGATAQSIRTLLRALGTKNDARYNLKILNTDDPSTEDGDSEAPAPRPAAAPAAESTDDFAAEEDSEPVQTLPEPMEDGDYEDDGLESDLAEKTRAELADLDDLDI